MVLGQTFGGLTLRQILLALSIIVVFIGLAWLVRFLLAKYIKKFTKKTKTNLYDKLLSVTRIPAIIIVVLAGFYLASHVLSREIAAWSYATKGLATALSVLGIYLAVALINTLIKWYRREATAKNKDVGFSIRLISFSWFLVIIVAIWLAVIASLSIWGQEVSMVTSWLGE